VHWYIEAAAQGEVVAQYNLGAMFESGQGVKLDHVEAHKWFNIAEVNGSQKAMESRRLIESLMTAAQIAEAQQRSSEWMKKNVR
jgi:TPR repeat protein